jgi:alkaline phosphatase D
MPSAEITRRHLLATGAAGAGFLLAGRRLAPAWGSGEDPFALGVASGYQSGWDGYPGQRARLLEALEHARNPIVVGGDWHTSWVNELKRDPGSATVAPELLAQAISSDPGFTDARSGPAVASNPVVRHYGNGNGYLRLRIRADELRAAFVDVDADSGSGPARVTSEWALEAGDPTPRTG